MQNIIKGTTLDINPRIIFKTQKPLDMILQKEKRNLCGQKCICENHNMCLKKNIVYKIPCTLCKDTFIWETSRTIRTIINEHNNQKFSEVYKHFIEKHKRSPELELIKWEIIVEEYTSALHKLKAEENIIKHQKSRINI